MKKQGGLDIDFLNKFQKQYDDEAKNIAIQLNKKLETIGGIIKKEIGIVPIPKEFINWYMDNHYKPKKRRIPFKLSDELVLKYCIEYKEEIENTIKEFSFKKDSTIEQKNQVIEVLQFAFKNDKKITNENLEVILNDLLFILSNYELPKEIKRLGVNDVGLKNESIRYCIYQVYELNKNSNTRKLLIKYLHQKFKAFDELDFNPENISASSTYKKFKTKPQYYPE